MKIKIAGIIREMKFPDSALQQAIVKHDLFEKVFRHSHSRQLVLH